MTATGKKIFVLDTSVINLRMKAKALQLRAEDYTTNHVQDPDHLSSGRIPVTSVGLCVLK